MQPFYVITTSVKENIKIKLINGENYYKQR